MKLLILIGSLASILSLKSQTIYVDDAPLAMEYGIKIQTNSLHVKDDTFYFKMKVEKYKNQTVYALKGISTVSDSWMYTSYILDSAKHTKIELMNDSSLLTHSNNIKHYFGDVVFVDGRRTSYACNPVSRATKSELKNFNVNRIMTSNEISFDFYPSEIAYYPWSITNASGREVASGTLYAHTPSESFKITADNLKAGRYTFTIGEGSDSRNENFSIY